VLEGFLDAGLGDDSPFNENLPQSLPLLSCHIERHMLEV
jgi:hypothetical protein